MPVSPFRPPTAQVLRSGQVVATFTSPDGWANIGLTPYKNNRVVGQRQVGYNSNPCPTGGLYRGPDPYATPERGYTGYWAYYVGCWATSWFPGASPIYSYWGSWYAPPQPVGPIYEPVYEYGFQYVCNSYASNGSTVAQSVEPPWQSPWFATIALRDSAWNETTTTLFSLLVCNPETEIQCGPSLKTADPCCLNCAEISARLTGLAASIQSAANLTQAKADQLIAQAAANRKKQPE